MYHEKSLEMHRSIHKEAPNARIAKCYNNLGNVHFSLHDYENAKFNYEKSLEIYRQFYQHQNGAAVNHPDIAHSLHNLGLVLKSMGKLERAKEHFEQSIRMVENFYAGDGDDDSLATAADSSNIHLNLNSFRSNLGDKMNNKINNNKNIINNKSDILNNNLHYKSLIKNLDQVNAELQKKSISKPVPAATAMRKRRLLPINDDNENENEEKENVIRSASVSSSHPKPETFKIVNGYYLLLLVVLVGIFSVLFLANFSASSVSYLKSYKKLLNILFGSSIVLK
jgi:tetratricopeptide (TPR) repeat protein